jgi:hypothetical protein
MEVFKPFPDALLRNGKRAAEVFDTKGMDFASTQL